VEVLIDDLTEAALEAIDQAAAEAARAAILSMIEREAAALRETEMWRLTAEANLQALTAARSDGRKNAVIAGLVCFLGGLVAGFCGSLANNW